MLRDLVQQARSGGTSAELEAVTAERDFFREKYAEQIDAMEVMKGQLKESQRIIDKLRGQVLDLELEKSGMVEQSKGTPKQIKTPKSIQSSGGSTDTSVTALSYDDDLTTKSGAEASVEPVSEAADADGPVASVASPRSAQKAEEQEGAQDVDSPEDDDEQSAPAPDVDSDEEEEDEESGSEDDEADNIRAKAERMLMWANYQSSKRSTPNTSMIRDEDDDDDDESKTETERPTPSKVVSDAIVYSLPTSLDERQNNLTDDDDDSTLGSSSRHHNPERSVGSWRSGANSGAGSSGKMGNLFNNLRDMIDPPSESEIDSESDEE